MKSYEKSDGSKTLLVLPANPVEAYVQKGTIARFMKDINPASLFDSIVLAYQSESNSQIAGIKARTYAAPTRLLPWSLLTFIVLCIRICISERISIIRAYCAELPGLVAGIVGLLTGTPVVVSVHGPIDDALRNRGYGRLAIALVNILHLIVYKLCTQIWCVSNWLALRIQNQGADSSKIEIIHNKVEISKIKAAANERDSVRKEYGFDRNEFILIHVGRLSADKRLDDAIEAVRYLVERKHHVKLLLVGEEVKLSGSMKNSLFTEREDTKSKLMGIVERLDVGDSVRFVGALSNDVVPRILAASDAYVSCGISEGFGIAIAEAQSAGCPIVATKELAQSSKGLLVNPMTAALYQSGFPEDLADKIEVLIENEQERMR
ncbi:MAG: glycosyltransferase, partial [Candidatus Thorarchaeota archaeon]